MGIIGIGRVMEAFARIASGRHAALLASTLLEQGDRERRRRRKRKHRRPPPKP